MSSSMITAAPAENLHLHKAKPSFLGIVRGEFLKISRQWATWIMATLLVCFITGPYVVTLTVSSLKANIDQHPLGFLYRELSYSLSILRVFAGIFLIIIAARTIGLEYQLGTIRVLLARGVGRLQLFFAKLLTVVIIALLILVVGILLNVLLLCGMLQITAGNLNVFNSATPAFWADARLYLASVMVSMGVSILMATTMAVLGRSQVFGLSAALAFFPIDNFGMLILFLGYRLTNSDVWLKITAYLLGPNLNQMPVVLSHSVVTIGFGPMVDVDGAHTLVVALVYAVIFAAVSIVLTWRRDVKE